MAKADKPNDDMDAIRAVMLTKQFGNYMSVSSMAAADLELYQESVQIMAEDIRKAVIRAGQRVVPDSGKVFLKKDWLGSRETIGAKIYTIMSATPEQFICYAAFRLKDAEDKEAAAKAESDSTHRQLRRLNRLIEEEDDIARIREAAREWEDEV